MSKHAKPFISRHPEMWPGAIAIAAIVAILAILGLNAKASESATKPTQRVYGTTGQCAVNVNGDCTVNHGLGTKPTSVVVVPAYGGQDATVDPAKTTDTTFTVRFLWRDGTRFKVGTVVKYNVVYTYVGTTVPTTPPPTTPTTTPTSTPTNPAGACENPAYTSSARESNGVGGYNDGGYHISNNIWNTDDPVGPQTISVCNYHNWSVVSNQPGNADNDSVKSYPDVQKPVKISMANVPDINTSWKVNTPSVTGNTTGKGQQWNAAYDLWLNNFDSEIMVWTNWNANWQYWYNQYGGEMKTIDGVEYYVYHKPASGGNASGIWFVRKSGVNQGSLNLKPLLDFAKTKTWVTNTDTLEYIEYGFEIMYTGAPTRFDVLDYSVNVGTVVTTPPTTPTAPPTTPTTTPTVPADKSCSPTNTVAHFTGEGSDAIADAPSSEQPGQYNVSAEQWAVQNDYSSNLCAYSKDNWYVEIKATDHGDGAVQSYPSIRKIYHDWGGPDNFDNDPKLSSFPQLKVAVAQTDPVDCTGCVYEQAFDIWLNGIGDGDSTTELMIWTHNQGQEPYGDLRGTVDVDGRTWDLYYGAPGYVAFVPKNNENIKSGTFDIKAFIEKAAENHLITKNPTDPTVGQISYGVEPVTTKGVFKRWDFTKFTVLDK